MDAVILKSSTPCLKRSLKSSMKILQETALSRSRTVTINKSVLARKQDDKMHIAQIQSLIKEKAMQGINTSTCLLILEEDIYFENLVTNIEKLYKQISGILREAISL